MPASDVDEFMREHMPRIVRHVAVEAPGIDLPAPERPALVVTVRFAPSHRLDFALAWRYAGGPLPYHAPMSADRDHVAEDAIRRRVEAIVAGCRAHRVRSRPGRCRGSTPPSSRRGCCPRSRPLDDVIVEIHGERPRYRELTGDPHVAVSTIETADPDWFDLGVIVTIDGRTIPFAPLFTALSRGRRKLLLSDGRYFSLAHPSLQRLRDLIDEAGDLDGMGDRARASAATRRHSGRTSRMWQTRPSPP